jgi:exosome complex exonuclease RRP6
MDVVHIEPSADPVVVAEIPFVSSQQRQVALVPELEGTENIVVVGQRQRKRKRKDKNKDSNDPQATPDTGRPKKRKTTPSADIVPFDFDSAPSILDAPPAAKPADANKGLKRRDGGSFILMPMVHDVLKQNICSLLFFGLGSSGIQYGNFGPAPRNLSEAKNGNQSRTFA